MQTLNVHGKWTQNAWNHRHCAWRGADFCRGGGGRRSCRRGHDAYHRGRLDGCACAMACCKGGCYASSNGLDRFAHVGRGGNDSRDDRFDRMTGRDLDCDESS